MTSAGYRNPLSDGTTAAINPALPQCPADTSPQPPWVSPWERVRDPASLASGGLTIAITSLQGCGSSVPGSAERVDRSGGSWPPSPGRGCPGRHYVVLRFPRGRQYPSEIEAAVVRHAR